MIDVCFFSGFTSEAASLEKQTAEILATIRDALARAQTDWAQVAKLSVLLQHGHEVEIVQKALDGVASVPEIEFSFVDGFAGEKYLLEIEATAVRR